MESTQDHENEKIELAEGNGSKDADIGHDTKTASGEGDGTALYANITDSAGAVAEGACDDYAVAFIENDLYT